MEEDHLNIKIVAGLFILMQTYYLCVEMYDLIQKILKMHPTGGSNTKTYLDLISKVPEQGTENKK